jgi:hypothetical protein
MMTPLSLLGAQIFLDKLTNADALQQQITAISAGIKTTVPLIASEQVVLSSIPMELADQNAQLSYPRVCVYSSNLKNSQIEKFRSFSGQVMLVAEIWASGDLITDVDAWIHFYVEGVANILQNNIGDWGNGMFYPGAYDVQFQPPKPGGLGFVQAAKLTFTLNVSLN